MTYTMPKRWQDWPDIPAKRVLAEILNTPPIDREKLRRESILIGEELRAQWAEEDRLKAEAQK